MFFSIVLQENAMNSVMFIYDGSYLTGVVNGNSARGLLNG